MKRGQMIKSINLFLGISLLLIFGCTSSDYSELRGAGATFPYPLYNKIFMDYYRNTGNDIIYDALGSSVGIRMFLRNQVDFGATDVMIEKTALPEDEIILHIPTCIGAVAVCYHLPGNPNLNLTSDILGKIFTGEIKKWNDPQIVEINKTTILPASEIKPVHRQDGSGTTYVFTEFLSKTNSTWATQIGKGKKIKWPNGIYARGNLGMINTILQTPGSIGYASLSHAKKEKLTIASIKNSAGKFVLPSLESIQTAAEENDLKNGYSLTNTKAEKGYPISSFSYILMNRNLDRMKSRIKAKNLIELINFITHEGQEHATSLGYGKLPENVVKIVEEKLKTVNYKNEFLYGGAP